MSSDSCDPKLKRSFCLETLSMFEEPQQSGERPPSVEDEDRDIQEADRTPREACLSLFYSLLKKSRKVKVRPEREEREMAATMRKERDKLSEKICIEEKRQKEEEKERQKVEKKEKERQWKEEKERQERERRRIDKQMRWTRRIEK
ncbi:hypothetical protein ABVT39_009015 [Epinephelus coioides]